MWISICFNSHEKQQNKIMYCIFILLSNSLNTALDGGYTDPFSQCLCIYVFFDVPALFLFGTVGNSLISNYHKLMNDL